MRPRNSRPYVRWWWLSGPFKKSDITHQLEWVRQNGFGGVELAWLAPSWLDEPERSAPRPDFLSPEWSRYVEFTRQECVRLTLDCDFTFGSAWPFGGSWLELADAAKTFTGWSSQRIGNSWESAPRDQVLVLDHLSAAALARYAAPLLRALAPALRQGNTALFCDSLEIATEELWSPILSQGFFDRFGYRLEPHMASLDDSPDIRYDYRKLRGEAILREFYEPFTALCHASGALARVQCHGAPADLLAAYAAVDIPESEALLFLPPFSRIAASAAAWAGHPVVSAESFTCLHGFPDWDEGVEELWKQETSGDLKLLADSLFANGVNHLIWHGMPYRPAGGSQEFYAAVHVGPDSPFAADLPDLNDYFDQVSRALQQGRTYATVGVYLPFEDGLMLDRIEDEDAPPGANFHWEMRDARYPEALAGYAAVWISLPFLHESTVVDGRIVSRELQLELLFIDCAWLDAAALLELERLASQGARIVWGQSPQQPGRRHTDDYGPTLSRLLESGATLSFCTPLLQGHDLPDFWAREIDTGLLIFFAHPLTRQITYPLPHRFAEGAGPCIRSVQIQWRNVLIHNYDLPFGHNESVLLRLSTSGNIESVPLKLRTT